MAAASVTSMPPPLPKIPNNIKSEDPNQGLNRTAVWHLNQVCDTLHGLKDSWGSMNTNPKALKVVSDLFYATSVEYKWSNDAAFQYLNDAKTLEKFSSEYNKAWLKHPMMGFMSAERAFGVQMARFTEQLSDVTTFMASNKQPRTITVLAENDWPVKLAKSYLSRFNL